VGKASGGHFVARLPILGMPTPVGRSHTRDVESGRDPRMKYPGPVIAWLSLLAMSCGTVVAQPHNDSRPDGGHPPPPMASRFNDAKY
jgi:hypothetical protein